MDWAEAEVGEVSEAGLGALPGRGGDRTVKGTPGDATSPDEGLGACTVTGEAADDVVEDDNEEEEEEEESVGREEDDAPGEDSRDATGLD